MRLWRTQRSAATRTYPMPPVRARQNETKKGRRKHDRVRTAGKGAADPATAKGNRSREPGDQPHRGRLPRLLEDDPGAPLRRSMVAPRAGPARSQHALDDYPYSAGTHRRAQDAYGL